MKTLENKLFFLRPEVGAQRPAWERAIHFVWRLDLLVGGGICLGYLLLRFAYGYTTRELAKEFGMTQSAVQKLIWRAKEALETIYTEGGDRT